MGGPAVMNLPFALAQKRLPPLMSRAAPPSEPAPSPQAQAPDNSIFLDRNDEGTATALSGPEGQNRQELPIKAFPEGATEGQSFAPEDVNLKGGFGNPFAGPLPPSDNPEFGNGMLPNSTSQFVPGVDVRGMSTDAGQPQGGHWEARLPDGQVITFDPNEARAAKRDQDAQDLREIDVALADPETKLNPQMFQYYIGKKQALLGGLSPAEIKQIYAQKGAFDLQGARLASNEGMQDKRLASQEKIATEKIAAQKSIAELRRKKGRSGALVPPLAAGEGSAYQKLFTQDPFKAEKLATQVDAQIGRSLKNMNWDKLQGIGTNRLSIALRNLDLGTGTGQFDAMMGFFGYLRGGVPAKNETDEWKSMTSTAETFLNKIGRKLKLGNMGTLALNGGDLSPEQKQALSEQVTGMDPSQAKEMRAAIVESQKALQDFAENAAESVRAQYANRAPAEKELAEGKIAGLLQYAGKTRTNSAAGGKSTLDSKLDALNKALGL